MKSWLLSSSRALHLATLVRALGLLVLVRSLKLGLLHIDYIGRTQILFDYWGWGWLPKPGALGAQALLGLSALGGGAMLLGRGRVAATGLGVASLAFTYVFLLDKAFFGSLNWAIVCMLLVLVLTRAWRVDAAQFMTTRLEALAPRLLLAIMYFYAGVIKLSPDWLSGDVVAAFLQASSAPEFMLATPVVATLAILGAAFDLCVGPLLIARKTRHIGLAMAVVFHTSNMVLLDVPEVAFGMLLLTLALFAPDKIHEKINKNKHITHTPNNTTSSPLPLHPARAFGLCAFLTFHLLFPLRPYIEPGDSRWTHHAQDFSWWLRSTHMSSDFEAFVTLDEQPPIKVDVPAYIDVENQSFFALDPALITQFAHHVARDHARRHPEVERVRVTVDARAQLDTRPWQQFIRPDVDLAAEPLRYDMSYLVVPLGASE